ncbi:hypothetical protein KFE25_007481 [Diacronema lutheri]|uniref:Uncharacterized protein n=2 Tax=Diacronema lutheri TaxID=2081491 RepID=A0A8J5XJI5_DIALT|nr:hypothetical protein KFE25_007481 [Diacronema lutheri]
MENDGPELPSVETMLQQGCPCPAGRCPDVRDGCPDASVVCPDGGCCPNAACGGCASSAFDFFDGAVDLAMPVLELLGAVAGCAASPCAFPLVFCFPPGPDSGGWAVSMLAAPSRRPIWCCGTCALPCVAQYFVRRRVLGGDMGRYALFQGRMDGPYCLARCSPSLPFTLRAGSHGEHNCPHACLCIESCACSVCAFHASRDLMRNERGLGPDPTEVRVDACLAAFAEIARAFAVCGCCLSCCGCATRCCVEPGSDAADAGADCSRLGGACSRIASAIYRGMWHVRNVAIACMSAQMAYEADLPHALGARTAEIWEGEAKASRRAYGGEGRGECQQARVSGGNAYGTHTAAGVLPLAMYPPSASPPAYPGIQRV